MPIYEYTCESCGQSNEIIQKISDPPETICPHCQQPTLKRLVSATGFQLKGTGWYVTDFRHKKEPDKKPTEKPAEQKTEKIDKKIDKKTQQINTDK